MEHYQIKYPVIFQKIAIDLALDRTKGMHKNYQGRDYYWGDKTKELNEQGILAELIAQFFLDTKNIDFKAVSFLGTDPEVEPDIVTNKAKIDVKYIPTYGRLLLVNFNAHKNVSKQIDHYLFVRPLNTLKNGFTDAELWYCSHGEVDKWEVESNFKTKVLKFHLRNSEKKQ